MQTHRFTDPERRLLLSEPRIGPRVVERLERLGVCSIRDLRNLGAGHVVDMICSDIGGKAWANRRSALESLITRVSS